ncbi:hypothetical protein I553_10344 [Mycobacterium xenopi 4042]|nr:hypothetical protein I553_10344 [Mycobacterium xenopi 4042]EUA24205.1 hypothetical protein I552_3489 [Mycobacterium xenopi 3993]
MSRAPHPADNEGLSSPPRARRGISASGFDMDIGVILFLLVLAIWVFAIWRDYGARRTHRKG